VDWIYLALGSEQCPMAGSCEHGNELSDSIIGGEFPDQSICVSGAVRTNRNVRDLFY